MKYLPLKLIAAVVLTAIHFWSIAQTDTTIFSSKFEQKIFADLADSVKVDPLEIALAFDYDQATLGDTRKKTETLKKVLEEKLAGQKKESKKIKIINAYLYEKYFLKQTSESNFNDLISKGTYNYVSASILYSMLFRHFSIEYQIKDLPTYITIIAGTGDNKTVVQEAMSKMDGIRIDEDFKTKYINYLSDIKIIGIDKIQNSSLDQLFKEYYDEYKCNTLSEIWALQYFNRGILRLIDDNLIGALSDVEKANILRPTYLNLYLKNTILIMLLESEKLQKKYNPVLLAKLINLDANDSDMMNYSTDFFKMVSNELIFTYPQKELYKNYFEVLLSVVADSINIDQIAEHYHYSLAYNEYVYSNFRQALYHLNRSYIINHDNVLTRGLVEEVGRKNFFTDTKHESTIDSLEAYFEIFPFMFQEKMYQQYYSYCFLHIISKAFRNDDVMKGKKYLVRFAKVMEENPDLAFHEEYVEHAFSDIAVYYMKNHKFQDAMKVIKKGLEIVPDAYTLKRLESEISTINTYKAQPYIYKPEKPAKDDYQERFEAMMENRCFVSATYTKDNTTTQVPDNEKIKIMSLEDKKVTYTYKNKTEKGKWAIRPKIKLFYLIPDSNKDEYITFKIVDFDGKTFKLRVYETDKSKQVIKLNKNIIEFKICN